MTSRSRKRQLARVEVLPRDQPDPGHPRHDRRILGGRRIGLQQLRQVAEIGLDVQAVDLLTHRRLHVEAGIDDARRWRVRLAVGTERNDRELVLKGVHRLVVLRRAGAVDASKDPHHAGGRLDLRHALGSVPDQPGPVMAYVWALPPVVREPATTNTSEKPSASA